MESDLSKLRYLAGLMATLLIFAAPLWAQEEEEACDTARWYCVEALNSGLPAVTPEIDRETPRATMESLVRAVRRDDDMIWIEYAEDALEDGDESAAFRGGFG